MVSQIDSELDAMARLLHRPVSRDLQRLVSTSTPHTTTRRHNRRSRFRLSRMSRVPKLVVTLCLICFVAGAAVILPFVIGNPGLAEYYTFENAPYGEASYLVYKSDSTYYMRNVDTGAIWTSTNASAIFNACMGNLTSGEIFVKAGTYSLGSGNPTFTWTDKSDITLHGEIGTIFQKAINPTIMLVNCTNFRIMGITFNWTTSPSDGACAVYVKDKGNRDIRISNCVFDHVSGSVSSGADMLYFSEIGGEECAVDGLWITNNVFKTSQVDAIALNGITHGWIVGNKIEEFGVFNGNAGGITNGEESSDDLHIIDNTISKVETSSTGGKMGMQIAWSTRVHIISNTIYGGNVSTGIRVDDCTEGAEIIGNEIDGEGYVYVAGKEGIAVTGSSNNEVRIIGNHIQNAKGNGIYSEGIHSIISNNIIENGWYNGITLQVGSHNTTIEGNIIDGNDNDGILTYQNDNIRILDNTIINNGRYGVYIVESVSENCEIKDNRFNSNTLGNIQDGGTGTIIEGNVGYTSWLDYDRGTSFPSSPMRGQQFYIYSNSTYSEGLYTYDGSQWNLSEGDCPESVSDTYSHPDGITEQTILEINLTSPIKLYNVYFDFANLTQDATLKVYSKINGTSYQELVKFRLTIGAEERYGIVMKQLVLDTDIKFTLTSSIAEGTSRIITYRYFKEEY